MNEEVNPVESTQEEPIIKIEDTIEYTEVFEVPLQNRMNAYWYNVISENERYNLTILAANSTAAQIATKQQFPNSIIRYLGESVKIMQVNDQTVCNV